MTHQVTLISTSRGGIVSTVCTKVCDYAEARKELAAEIKARRASKRFFIARDGLNRYYCSTFDGSMRTTARIEYHDDLETQAMRRMMAKNLAELGCEGAFL